MKIFREKQFASARFLLPTIILLLSSICPNPLRAQTDEEATAPAGPPHGLQIRNVSVYGAYYSSGLPNTGSLPLAGTNLPSNAAFGGSAEFAWSEFSDRSSFSVSYTPSYIAQTQYSSLDALNHALTLTANRHFAPRWNFTLGVNANLSTLAESLFAPTQSGALAAVPSTFQDLASALLQSQFANNPQLGTLLSSAPVTQSPLNTLFYGERMFNTSVQSSLSYSYSPRLSLTFTVGGTRAEHLSDNEPGATSATSLALNTTSGRAVAALSYSLSPRTQISASVTSSRSVSSLYDAYATTGLVSIGRTVAHRWILQAHGGAGVANPVREIGVLAPVKPYPSGGGSVTLKTTSHTFIASIDRTVSDAYGLGATTSSTASGTWRWRIPGRAWWFDSTFSWQQMQGNALANTTGWRSTTGFNQAVGPHMVLRGEYAYLSYSGGLQNSLYNFSQSAVRFSVSWIPPADALR